MASIWFGLFMVFAGLLSIGSGIWEVVNGDSYVHKKDVRKCFELYEKTSTQTFEYNGQKITDSDGNNTFFAAKTIREVVDNVNKLLGS